MGLVFVGMIVALSCAAPKAKDTAAGGVQNSDASSVDVAAESAAGETQTASSADMTEPEKNVPSQTAKKNSNSLLEGISVWSCVGNMLLCSLLGGFIMSFVGMFFALFVYALSNTEMNWALVFYFISAGCSFGFFAGLFKSILNVLILLEKSLKGD